MANLTWTKQQLTKAVRTSETWSQVLRELGLVISGTSFRHVQKHARELNLDVSHFLGKSWSKGRQLPNRRDGIPLKKVLVKNSTYKTNHLKNRLFREGLKERRCEVCGLTEWNGKPAALQLDHISGNRIDHRLHNLRIVCPNCHAQTETYCRKMRG